MPKRTTNQKPYSSDPTETTVTSGPIKFNRRAYAKEDDQPKPCSSDPTEKTSGPIKFNRRHANKEENQLKKIALLRPNRKSATKKYQKKKEEGHGPTKDEVVATVQCKMLNMNDAIRTSYYTYVRLDLLL